MKVLFSSQYTVEFDGKHYYDYALNDTYRRYLVLGNDLTVLASKKDVEHPQTSMIDDNAFNFAFYHKINTLKKKLNLTLNKENRSIVEEAVKNSDICVAHIPSTISNIMIKCAKKYNKPYMTVVVGCPWDSLWNYDWRGKIMAPFEYLKMKIIQKNAPYSIYVTKYFLERRYPTKGKYINCSNVNVHTGIEDALINRLQKINSSIGKGKIYKIGTSAAVNVPYKGQEYVIRAIAELSNQGYAFEYHMIGNGNPDRLRKIADSLGVSEKCYFHGSIPHDKVLAFLDEMDIYIQPSKQEGLPRATIEAMSRGCLCLGSDIAGLPELIDTEYRFKKGDYRQIAKILKTISSSALLKQAKLNFEKAKEYDVDKLTEKRKSFLLEFKKSSF